MSLTAQILLVYIQNRSEQLFQFVPVVNAVSGVTTTTTPESAETIQDLIPVFAKKYGVDADLATRIITCESQMYKEAINANYNSKGEVWSHDYGPWQINDYFHKESARKLGFNIFDPKENLEYGFVLLKTQGTRPWKASQQCWDK